MEEVKKIIKEIFSYIDEDIRVIFELKEEKSLLVDVKMKEPQRLIGEKGQTLIETERLLKIIARKKAEEVLFINLDVNDYKKRKAEYLIDLAVDVAREVSLTGVEKKFPPMSSFERRIIHKTLMKRDDVITASDGVNEERRVVVKKKRE
jgi:spoIIIJ-associated protein